MNHYRKSLALMFAAATLLVPSVASAREDHEIADAKFLPATSAGKSSVNKSHCTDSVVQTFSGTTSWDVCFSAVSKFGLIVRLADFKKTPSSSAIRVLYDGRISEIFVPYHAGTPRYFDVTQFNFPLLTLSTSDCPAPRTIIGGGKVCKEVRDRGLAWKKDSLVRRGLELVLWSVLDAANYNYVIEWTFRDDGSIAARAGSTGPKLGGPSDTRGHMHNFSWRLDIDLNGSSGDSAYLDRHFENLGVTPSTGTDVEALLTREGGWDWDARNFSVLKVGDATLRNSRNRPTTYALIPSRTGTAIHTEPHMQKPFWVTQYNGAELFAKDVATYVNGQAINNQDIVVWYTATAHHENDMRDEDRQTVPLIWVGFELVASNLFDDTPFYPISTDTIAAKR